MYMYLAGGRRSEHETTSLKPFEVLISKASELTHLVFNFVSKTLGTGITPLNFPMQFLPLWLLRPFTHFVTPLPPVQPFLVPWSSSGYSGYV